METFSTVNKILMTLAVSVWTILLRDWASLLALVVVELVYCFGRFVIQTTEPCWH